MITMGADSEEQRQQHVAHILVAEFDIDKGSTLTLEYPTKTGVDPQSLAEHMLPDGAHKREEDWTVFFLNQDEAPVTEFVVMEADVYTFSPTGEWVTMSEEPLEVVLSEGCIRVLDDTGQQFHVFEAAAELQNKSLEPGRLFHCVIDGEMALGFQFADSHEENEFEKHCKSLQGKRAYSVPQTGRRYSERTKGRPMLHVLNLIRNRADDTARRGAVVKAVAICTRHPYIQVFKPLLLLAVDQLVRSGSNEVIADLFESINKMNLGGMKTLDDIEKENIQYTEDVSKRYFKTTVNFMKSPIPVQIPYVVNSDHITCQSVIKLINTFKSQTMTIVNAVLLNKRIIFQGYNIPAMEVISHVLAMVRLVCPPIKGILSQVYPLVNLKNLSFLEKPAYLVGVTNPIFESNTQWWDIFCSVETGVVLINPTMTSTAVPGPQDILYRKEEAFLQNVLQAIAQHCGEEYVRRAFNEYVGHIYDMVRGVAEFEDDASASTGMQYNAARIEAVKQTPMFIAYDIKEENNRETWIVKNMDVRRTMKRLRVRKKMSEKELFDIYAEIGANIRTDEEIAELSASLPDCEGGLYPILVSIFHPSQAIRRAVVELIKKLDNAKSSAARMRNLNPTFRMAYKRNSYLLEM